MNVIDIHTHGMGGVDTRTADPADILRLAKVHGAAGVDVIIPVIYSGPIDTMRANLCAVRGAMERPRGIGESGNRRGGEVAREKLGEGTETLTGRMGEGEQKRPREEERERKQLETGNRRNGESETKDLEKQRGETATILGAYLEGPFLNPLQAGALDASSFLTPSAYDLDRLLDGFEDIVRIVTIAPELPGALTLIHSMADRGIVVTMGHSDATYAEAEAGFQAGAPGVTHLFNAMRGFHHREPGLAGFGLLNPHIYAEVIADPFHLHDETLRLIFSAKNRDRIMIISDSVKETATAQAEEAISDTQGRLRGGSFSLRQSSKRLLELGYDEGLVNGVTFLNQHRYLGLRG